MRGSFTGATDTRPGLFEFANNGTVFLDEVGETSLAIQAKLLRVIKNREIQRVGSPEVLKINVRLIAATNRDLRAEVLAERFREDLYYRFFPRAGGSNQQNVGVVPRYLAREVKYFQHRRAFPHDAVNSKSFSNCSSSSRTRRR
jgi:Mg-chelatase subunit ChlI